MARNFSFLDNFVVNFLQVNCVLLRRDDNDKMYRKNRWVATGPQDMIIEGLNATKNNGKFSENGKIRRE